MIIFPNAVFTGKLVQINRQLDCSFKVNKCTAAHAIHATKSKRFVVQLVFFVELSIKAALQCIRCNGFRIFFFSRYQTTNDFSKSATNKQTTWAHECKRNDCCITPKREVRTKKDYNRVLWKFFSVVWCNDQLKTIISLEGMQYCTEHGLYLKRAVNNNCKSVLIIKIPTSIKL